MAIKVLLINPPTDHILRESLPAVVEDESGRFPPLGLLYVAAYAENVEGCTVKVIDCQVRDFTEEGLVKDIKEFAPDVVGIQAMTFTLIDATITAKAAKKAVPDALVVMGGPHPTIYPSETVSIPEVDAVIPGEGEFIFESLIRALSQGNPPEGVKGVMTKKTKDIPIDFKTIEDLDVLKMPARHLINAEDYTTPLAVKNPITTLMSSRGCPARCIFCDRPAMGKRFRKKSAQAVFREMKYCVEELGIGEIFFYDDTFTVDKQRVFDLCDLIIRDGLDVHWDVRSRVNTVTRELVARMAEAGCHRIHYGVETGSERIQQVIRKNLKMSDVHEVFKYTMDLGVEVLGYFMIGNPTETREDVMMTIDLITKLPMDYAHVAILTPYPATEIYTKALADGVYDHDYWREYSLNPTPDFHPRYWNEHFTDEELLKFSRQAYARFYSRPGYIIRRLTKVRSLNELYQKSRLGFKLLKSLIW